MGFCQGLLEIESVSDQNPQIPLPVLETAVNKKQVSKQYFMWMSARETKVVKVIKVILSEAHNNNIGHQVITNLVKSHQK